MNIVNIPLEVCTKTNIKSNAIAMYPPDTSTKISLKNIQLSIVHYACAQPTNIQGYVMAMYSPDKSTSEDLKGIIET